MILAKYGAAFTFRVPMLATAATDQAGSSTWTPAAGDVKVVKDGSAASIGTLPSVVVAGAGALWAFALTATEMQAKEIVVTIVDLSSPKVIQDNAILIYTFGHASAQMPFDLGTATVSIGIDGIADVSVSAGAQAVLANAMADGVLDAARTDHVLAGSIGETLTSVNSRIPTSGTISKSTDITAALAALGSAVSYGLTQTGSTLTSVKLASGDTGATDAYVGHMIIVRHASGAVEHGIITTNNGSTKVATIDRQLITIPAAGVPYEIL